MLPVGLIQKSEIFNCRKWVEKKKFRAIAEVSNEYLFEYDTHDKALVPYEKLKTLLATPEAIQEASKALLSYLGGQPSDGPSPVMTLVLGSGKQGFFKMSASRVSGKKERGTTWIGKLQDISEEIEKLNHLQGLAQTDGLTGLLNAATTRLRIKERLKTRKSSEIDFCILFDLDDFKAVNDTSGHLAGDRVLTTVGAILLQGSRCPDDIIGRVGGDEFCIYLVGLASEEEGLSYCTALLDSVRFALHAQGVTISIGGSRVEEKDTYEMLYARVDHAMYQAKNRGKDRIQVFSSQAVD